MAKATRGPKGTPFLNTYRAQSSALTRGYAVKQGTADDQCILAGAAEEAIGIVAESALENALVPVVQDGECIAIAGTGGVAAGNWVKVEAGGKLVASAGEDTANIGRARTTAAADGDEFVLAVKEVKKRS
jgi:hypothetical protein